MKIKKPIFYGAARFLGLISLLIFVLQTTYAADDAQPSKDYVLCNAWKLGDDLDTQSCRTDKKTDFSAGINDTLVLKIKNFNALVAKAKCQDMMNQLLPQTQQCVPQKIFLYFDGRKVSERNPNKDGKLGMDNDTIEFSLRQTQQNDDGTISENKDVWIDLLGSPKQNFFLKPTKIEVGLESGYVIPGSIGFMLTRINKFWFWVCQVIIGIFFIAGLVLAAKSDILRNPGAKPVNKKKPWSLARCQMAFWLFLVVTSFLFIWLVTGALDTITDGVLVLMGIGSGTALGSALIDAADDKFEKISKLRMQQDKLMAELVEIGKNLASSPSDLILNAKKKEMEFDLKMIGDQLESIKKPAESQGFFIDIVSGPSGVTLHRFQMLIWTVILGIIFIFSVWKRLSMPDFGAMLLALQGISAGTYLGFKIPEKNG